MSNLMLDSYDVLKRKVDNYIKNYNGEPYQFMGCKTGDYFNDSERVYFSKKGGWMASFITGLGPMMYRAEKDEKYLKWAEQFKEDYRKLIFDDPINKVQHDVGFLYSLYCVAMYKLTRDKDYREIALKAADELIKRFNINARVIQSFGYMNQYDYIHRVIIDTMMNLPLLFWAFEETGHRFYKQVAETHCETISKLLIRNDYSVCHAFIFDKDSGEFLGEGNTCGYDNGTHWARGTAWAIYGYAIAARYLKSEQYFDLASKIAEKYISSIPEDGCIPPWDFRLPSDMPAKVYAPVFVKPENRIKADWDETKVENCKYNVDASACAIVTCGLIELNKFKNNEKFEDFVEKSLDELCKNYFNKELSVQGMIKRQNGMDVYALYGDYFFAEALVSKLFNSEVPW